MNTKNSLILLVPILYVSAIVVLSSISNIIPESAADELSAEITQGSSAKTLDAFSPNPINSHVGDNVTWMNRDTIPHTVTSGINGRSDGTFDSSPNFNPLIAPGGTFSHTFTQAGGFPYYCSLHPNMIGTVIVAGVGGSNQTSGSNNQTSGSNNQTSGGKFTIMGMDEKGNTYNITGFSQNAIGKSFSINSGKSVEIQFNGTGEVELSLPRDLISNVTTVLSGNETIQHEIIDENATATTISFEIPNGKTAIDIMGGFVVPEFSVIAAILAVAIVVVIGVLKFAGNTSGLVGRI